MPFVINHLPEHHLLIQRFYGIVTLEDVRELNKQGTAIVAAAETTTHLLVDLRYVEKYPSSIDEIRKILVVSQNFNPKLGWVVLLTRDSKPMKLVAAVITQVSALGVRFRMFDNPRQAFSFLLVLDISWHLREPLLVLLNQPPSFIED